MSGERQVRGVRHSTMRATVWDEGQHYYVVAAADPDTERYLGRAPVAVRKEEWVAITKGGEDV